MGALTTLDISSNIIVADLYIKAPRKGIKVGELIDGNPVIKEEDRDGEIKICKLVGIRAIASAIPDMGALSSLNLANNNIGMLSEEDGWTAVSTDTYEQGQIVEGNYKQSGLWYPGKITDVTDGTYGITYDDGDAESNVAAVFIKSPEEDKEIQWQHTDGRQQDSKPAKAALGVIALANAIPNMGALSHFDISKNNIGSPLPPTGWSHLPGNKPDFQFKRLTPSWQQKTYSGAAPAGTEYPGVVAIANAIKDMGAISSVNLLQNDIGTDQAKVLASIIKEHPTLKSLCGNKGDEAELDMSGKDMHKWDAIMLAAEIVDNRAPLTSLNLASNSLGVEGAKIIAAILPKCM
jgi:hypothetical protein